MPSHEICLSQKIIEKSAVRKQANRKRSHKEIKYNLTFSFKQFFACLLCFNIVHLPYLFSYASDYRNYNTVSALFICTVQRYIGKTESARKAL